MEIKDLTIYQKTIPPTPPQYAPYPSGLSAEICTHLSSTGIQSLYTHQAEMFTQAIRGENIVITTSTASGKTLGFLLPVIQEILSHPQSRAIFLYPTKALASDQYRAIQPWTEAFGQHRLSAGVYDGDTPPAERSRIRKNANIILTNPEMLNSAFLPNHSKAGFDFIFSNLKYIVIDELHTYRGAFGSHLANVFRRLSRICRYYHASPQFLCSSATIANPVELARAVCQREFICIDRDGSPAPEKTYVFLQPPKIYGKDNQYYGQVQSTSVAASMAAELTEKGKSFLTFAKSRRNVEVILKEARDMLEGEGIPGAGLTERISGYRGGYTPRERKEIERKMTSGELCGLISTNALELGIDIGKIDTTVLAGFPGTRASFWQQTGRAGRSGRACTNYLILDNLPFDQYISINPDWLFDGESESAVVDRDNLLIELAHIRAAAAELPLTLDDIAVFPDLGETIPVLLRVKELHAQDGRFAWSGDTFPAGDYSLRNIDKVRYKLVDRENSRIITEMDEMQAFREIHEGAVYMHGGAQYEVIQMDRDTKTSYAVPFCGNYYTMPGSAAAIRIIHGSAEKEYKRTKVSFGDVNVKESVYMYKKLQFHNHQNLGYGQLEPPLTKDFDTESTWITIPQNVVKVYRGLIRETGNGQVLRNNHFEGICYAIRNAARMATMTEQEDIGVTMSGNALDMGAGLEEEVCLYIFDEYVGGLGYAEKAYELMPKIIEHAIEMVRGCKCKDGCAACIGDYRLDKDIVCWGLENLLTQRDSPMGMKLPDHVPSTYMQKPFVFAELPSKWKEFCAFLSRKGEAMAAFLNTVEEVSVEGNILFLPTSGTFYRTWILEDANRLSLKNMIAFYTDAPAALRLEVYLSDKGSDKKETEEKIRRRYSHLHDGKNG